MPCQFKNNLRRITLGIRLILYGEYLYLLLSRISNHWLFKQVFVKELEQPYNLILRKNMLVSEVVCNTNSGSQESGN